ncbi:hypothetical protein [Salinibacillus xinjiangensis]|uniref:Lipoprotein n=1 Tax=Salinibacillus xinjiangensis TaxID=1229268 RepID=A0A6G1XA67_9BACI|nr:hypothetical protein [Salinibacillus xinjiangensis]MRG87770.1 hypothetical protein [Salinibacillus xinjiangensis]
MRYALSVILCLGIVVLSGCGSEETAEDNTETVSEENTATDANQGNEKETESNGDKASNTEAEVEPVNKEGENLSVPESFPPDILIPDGANIIKKEVVPEENGVRNTIKFLLDQDMNSIAEQYIAFFEENGYTIASQTELEGVSKGIRAVQINTETGVMVDIFTPEEGPVETTLEVF